MAEMVSMAANGDIIIKLTAHERKTLFTALDRVNLEDTDLDPPTVLNLWRYMRSE